MLASLKVIEITSGSFAAIMEQCNKLLFYPIEIFGFSCSLIELMVYEVVVGLLLTPIFKLFSVGHGD